MSGVFALTTNPQPLTAALQTGADGPRLSAPTFPQVVTITGGTGSFGQALVARLLAEPHGPKVRVVSRDEKKHDDMARQWPAGPRLTYVLGDVRDVATLRRAFDGADAVVHAAAYKIVGQGEIHPAEFTHTNTLGTLNVMNAAIDCGVARALLISTDKACSPLNTYGNTKALAERFFVHGNSLGVTRGSRFATVRGGNIWNSRGSVMQVWRAAVAAGQRITVNGADTTRFHLTMEDWLAFAWQALLTMHGGEVFIPKAPAWRLGDLARAFTPVFDVVGARPGDKAAEWLYSGEESYRVVDAGWAYVLEPGVEVRGVWSYQPWWGVEVAQGVPYSSAGAPRVEGEALERLVGEVTR